MTPNLNEMKLPLSSLSVVLVGILICCLLPLLSSPDLRYVATGNIKEDNKIYRQTLKKELKEKKMWEKSHKKEMKTLTQWENKYPTIPYDGSSLKK